MAYVLIAILHVVMRILHVWDNLCKWKIKIIPFALVLIIGKVDFAIGIPLPWLFPTTIRWLTKGVRDL